MSSPVRDQDQVRPAPLWQRALIILVGVAAAGVMACLGLWQAQVFIDDGERNAAARADLPSGVVDEVASPEVSPVDWYGRTVTMTGEYLPSYQLFIPDGEHYRVLTAFETDRGNIVPVIRGVVDEPSAPAPPSGVVERSGVLLASELEVGGALPEGQIGSVRLPELAQSWPRPMISGYVTLPLDQAQAEGFAEADVLRLPDASGSARSRGYSLQWWIFGAFALGISIKIAHDAGRGKGVLTRTL
ncbi:SURF1 family protein [Naumannella halotolerans]|uniref:SURF1-like protein n=1 Tax=Naumannella halotolerans TaxID=993414 RepID=A0A4R7J3C4_9ACTN|nr:SURF1 family protein [Naumannella halotolerans]TDT30996.1 cytochrome oxidase assembly protein ShyY1 [Naumannella halotolerans]